jgi:serine transporter
MKKIDLQWIFVLFGTAVGAGILFLPLQASASGFLPMLIATVIVLPMIFYAERNVSTLAMSYAEKNVGITEVFSNELGQFGAFVSKIIYLLSCYTVVLAYAISLPRASASLFGTIGFSHTQIFHSIWFSFLLFMILIAIVELGRNLVLRVMSYVIYPLALALIVVSVSLIPKWNMSFIVNTSLDPLDIFKGLIMMIPILVFSMNFNQSISEMCVYYKQENESNEIAKAKVYKNIRIATVTVLFFTMFFAFSTIMALQPEQITEALNNNESILAKIAEVYHASFFGYMAPFIAVAGIVSSFIGVYLGTRESLRSVIVQIVHKDPESIKRESAIATDIFVVLFIFITLWLVSIFNPSIVSVLGQFTAPCIALMIFFLPLIIIYRSNRMIGYRNNLRSVLLAIFGLVVVVGYFVGSYF